MKAKIAVLVMLMAAFVLLALSSFAQSQSGLSGYEDSRLSTMSSDTKRLEERMRGALNDMMSQSQSKESGKGRYGGFTNTSPKITIPLDSKSSASNLNSTNASAINSSAAKRSAINSSKTNASVISSSAANKPAISSSAANASAINSSATNRSAIMATTNTSSVPESSKHSQESLIGPQEIGSSSNSKFNGSYGITSSQHQMGKNDIDSRISLSGSFSLDKSVKFQDIGI